ncbi:TPA: GTP cyclohydrolase I FolE [Vibrio parahaemolyticus]|nr:GTP cyclohydrolase I FolE [Vibrio parahaemolyticus]MDF4873599.1 GTP cyclohydrolase I FolE [Vibrio parahaemolyticus]HCG8583606.1 GTP cyclohydrolase I FolE [Vibrio parahaemolyticus]HCG9752868.1 GTP cyclohydrolase I FolE [Vibrio parahaemolyticus]HCH1656963.1 GTP cyclohydrolase I FolE [Vibrio parahaemolyticus]
MIELSHEARLVRDALRECGLETPMKEQSLDRSQRLDLISNAVRDILNALSLDLSDDSLSETPNRMAKMYVDEIFSGLNYENFPKITTIENKMYVDEEIVVKDISFTSTCEHHMVVIDGMATVGYIPRDKVIGLSKINRLVRFFAQRPQVQERLTAQIFVALKTLLGVEDVYVKLEATHYCVKSRGVEDICSFTTTLKSGGNYKASKNKI